MRRTAFTLVELMVAFCVLCLAAAVLAPVFMRSRESCGPRNSCPSNQRQIALGFKQYMQDYNDTFPIYNVPKLGSVNSKTFTANSQARVTHWAHALQPYIKSIQIFQCRSELQTLGTDYYYNLVVSGKPGWQFNNSSKTILLAEGVDTNDSSLAVATAAQTTGAPPPYTRHLEGSNYAFVDGHVKWLNSTRAPANSTVGSSAGGFTFGS